MNQILLIEEQPSIGASLENGFRASGFTLRGVTDLRQARAQLAEASFTAVLLDVRLPDARRIEICQEIQKRDPALPIFKLAINGDAISLVSSDPPRNSPSVTSHLERNQPVDLVGLLLAEVRKRESMPRDRRDLAWNFIDPCGGDVWINGDPRVIRRFVGSALEYRCCHAASYIEMRLEGDGREHINLVLQDDGSIPVGPVPLILEAIARWNGWRLQIANGLAAKLVLGVRRIYTKNQGF